MLNTPECLAPVIEELEKNINQIAVLNGKNSTLEEEVHSLKSKQEEMEQARADESEKFTSNIASLEDENLSVNSQLREKETNIDQLQQDNDALNEKISRINSENIRVNAGQEALSHQSQNQSAEIDKITKENEALKEELSSLKLMNSIAVQKSLDEQGISGDEALELEIKRLKQELLENKNEKQDSSDSFLEDENKRLVQRHGEITQEKMQASSKMHAAQNQLEEVVLQLDTARKSISELTFEYEGLQNLHQNLVSERNILVDDKKSLEEENNRLSQSLASKTRIEEQSIDDDALVPQNITKNEFTEDVPILEIESTNNDGPHFPSESRE